MHADTYNTAKMCLPVAESLVMLSAIGIVAVMPGRPESSQKIIRGARQQTQLWATMLSLLKMWDKYQHTVSP